MATEVSTRSGYARMIAHAIDTVKVEVTTAGGAGEATGSEVSPPLEGFLLDVYLDYHASCPETADVTVAYTDCGGNIVVKSNSNTDALLMPRKQVCGVDGAAVTGVYDLYPLDGQTLTISVAQADALTNCLVATLRYLR